MLTLSLSKSTRTLKTFSSLVTEPVEASGQESGLIGSNFYLSFPQLPLSPHKFLTEARVLAHPQLFADPLSHSNLDSPTHHISCGVATMSYSTPAGYSTELQPIESINVAYYEPAPVPTPMPITETPPPRKTPSDVCFPNHPRVRFTVLRISGFLGFAAAVFFIYVLITQMHIELKPGFGPKSPRYVEGIIGILPLPIRFAFYISFILGCVLVILALLLLLYRDVFGTKSLEDLEASKPLLNGHETPQITPA